MKERLGLGFTESVLIMALYWTFATHLHTHTVRHTLATATEGIFPSP